MKTFGDRVKEFNGRLTESDRALVAWVLNNPEEAVYISSAELANKAEVHASTVVRLAHKIGYEGFPAMRNHIRENVQSRPTSFPTQQRKLDQIKTSSNLSMLIEAEILALSSVINSVTQNQIDLAAKVLANAGTVFIVGRGSAAPLVVHLERRLRRNAIRTEVALNLQWRDLAEHAIGLRHNDAIIIFAFQAPVSLPSGYEALIRHANRTGAKSIVISDATGPTLRPPPDQLLCVSRPDEGSLQLRTGPLLVTEAIAMALANINLDRALGGLGDLEKLRQKRQLEEKSDE